MNPLVMMRAHFSNGHVEKSFAALTRCCRASPPYLLLDVTRGDIDTALPAIKFSGDRLLSIGLELYPEELWAWFAGDYALYCAFLEHPDHSHYVMIDYDARVNFSIDDLMMKIADGGYDFAGLNVGLAHEDWFWTAAGRYWFDRVGASFFPFVVLSRRLLVRCLEYRLLQSRQVPEKKRAKQAFLAERWMNCEPFVPSVALAAGYSMIDIRALVPGWQHDFIDDSGALYWGMPELADVPFAHPVFLKKDLPWQIRRTLDAYNDDRRYAFMDRVKSLHAGDARLWRAIVGMNPELDT